MRFLACAILLAFLAIGIQAPRALGQTSLFGWWPYGHQEKETFVQTPSMLEQRPAMSANAGAQPPATSTTQPMAAPNDAAASGASGVGRSAASASRLSQPPAAAGGAITDSPYLQSPFADWTWPRLRLPQIHLPKPRWPSLPGATEYEQARNTWVEKHPEPQQPSPWQAVTDGASRVGASTKAAWQRTVDVFTPGEKSQPASRVAQRDAPPSIWNRMFSGGAEPPPEGPRTVTEWMGQERLKP